MVLTHWEFIFIFLFKYWSHSHTAENKYSVVRAIPQVIGRGQNYPSYHTHTPLTNSHQVLHTWLRPPYLLTCHIWSSQHLRRRSKPRYMRESTPNCSRRAHTLYSLATRSGLRVSVIHTPTTVVNIRTTAPGATRWHPSIFFNGGSSSSSRAVYQTLALRFYFNSSTVINDCRS